MTLLSNCIGLLLKRTPEIIYLQKSAVNSPITDSVLDPPSHNPPQPQNTFFKIQCNYISLGTKYDVLQFESSLCFSSSCWRRRSMYRGKGAVLVSCDLMRCLQHLHQEGVDGRVADQLEKEQMLQTFEADGAQGGQAQQQLGKPSKMKREERKTSSVVSPEMFRIFNISSISFHSLSHLPGWSGYFCFVYDSSDA